MARSRSRYELMKKQELIVELENMETQIKSINELLMGSQDLVIKSKERSAIFETRARTFLAAHKAVVDAIANEKFTGSFV